VGVTKRVAYARQLVAEGHSPSALARILQISRQAIYRIPTKPPTTVSRSRPPVDEVEAAIVQVAEQNPTDGYRIVTTWVRRKLGRAVNRKRVLRVMRERKLIQRRTHEPHRRRPGFFQVERPGQLWHLDMTSIWVAEHGWVYLNAIIDCCTRDHRLGAQRPLPRHGSDRGDPDRRLRTGHPARHAYARDGRMKVKWQVERVGGILWLGAGD
jgi:HTH-like domain/Helix-turn-helix domain of resolvase